MATKLTLGILTLLAGASILLYAFSVTELWIAWLLTTGFVAGASTAKLTRSIIVVCGAAIVLLILAVCVRFLPIYNLNWRGADKIEISNITGDWSISLTDPNEILEFTKFGERGSYRSMLKSGYGLHVYVTHDGSSSGYYIHGNAIGRNTGGFTQSIFVPYRDGFTEYLENLIDKNGHSRTRP